MNPQVKIIHDEFKQKGDKVKLENMNKILIYYVKGFLKFQI